MLTYIPNMAHYEKLLSLFPEVSILSGFVLLTSKTSMWKTANIVRHVNEESIVLPQ